MAYACFSALMGTAGKERGGAWLRGHAPRLLKEDYYEKPKIRNTF